MKDTIEQRSPQMALPDQTPVLSIIIISYNTRDMTLACLASVYAETTQPFEVIVVDNASSDGSAEAIARDFPQATLIAETTNHGFAPAHDIALPHCRGNWLLLLNPDTVVLDGALDKLMEFARRRPDAGIWGGRTVFADGSLNPFSCSRRMSLWTIFCRTAGLTGLFPKSRIFNAEEYGDWPRDTEAEVDIVTGCLFLLRRETWDALGGFDPAFTMYGEEADLCRRAQKMGARPAITPEATIIHYGGASEKVPADRIIRVLRAKAELIKRHFPFFIKGLSLFLFGLFPLSRRLANGLAGRILNRPGLVENARIWQEVWRRRAEWNNGFSA